MINHPEKPGKGSKLFLGWCLTIIAVVLFAVMVIGGFEIMHNQLLAIVKG